MEGDAEARADEVGDAAGSPEIGGEAVVGGLVGKPAEHLGLLPGGEEALAARVRLGGEGVGPGRAVGAHPSVDGDGVDAEELGDILLLPAGEDLLDAEAPAGFHPGPSVYIHDADRIQSHQPIRQDQLPAGQ